MIANSPRLHNPLGLIRPWQFGVARVSPEEIGDMAAEPSRSKRKEVDVGELLKRLRLNEAEREGIVLAKGKGEAPPMMNWMAVVKLLTVREFSEASLTSTMKSAWGLARDVSFRSIEKNLFTVQALCLGDWKRIMEDGP